MRTWILPTLLLLVLHDFALGQNGCFQFQTDSIGCAPFKVRVLNCNPPGEAVSYNFDLVRDQTAWFQAPISNNGDTSYTYEIPGYYVFAQAPSGQFSNPLRRVVRVYNQNIKPMYSLNFCLGNLSITLPDTIFKNYVVTVGGIEFSRNAASTLVVPISFAPGETRKKIPFSVTGILSTNCGNNTVLDTAIIYSSIPRFNIDTVAEVIVGDASRFRIRASVPALANIKVAIRDAALSWDTVVTTGPSQEFIDILKTYSAPSQPNFIITTSSNCPTPLNLKDSLVGVIPIPTLNGGQILITFPPLPRPYSVVKVWVNDTLQTTVPSIYQEGDYRFRALAGCQRNNCVDLSFIDSDRGQPSVFNPARRCVIVSTTTGQTAILKGTVVEGSMQHFLFDQAVPLKSAMFSGAPVIISQVPTGKQVSIPYDKTACYLLQLHDSCNFDVAPPTGICALRLVARQVDHLSASLSWSRPRPLRSPINLFRLYARDNAGNVLQVIETSDSTFIDRSNYLEQPVLYVVEGIPDDSSSNGASVSEIVPVIREVKAVIPSALSPNGDGDNDSLTARIFNLKTFNLKVTNRWGEVVFFKEYSSAAVESPKVSATWDGRFKGRPVPSGAYFATISGKTYLNQKFTATQMVQVIQ